MLQARINSEYNVPISFELINFELARWVVADDKKELDRFISTNKLEMAEDKYGDPVYLAQSVWWLGRAERDFPKITSGDYQGTALDRVAGMMGLARAIAGEVQDCLSVARKAPPTFSRRGHWRTCRR